MKKEWCFTFGKKFCKINTCDMNFLTDNKIKYQQNFKILFAKFNIWERFTEKQKLCTNQIYLWKQINVERPNSKPFNISNNDPKKIKYRTANKDDILNYLTGIKSAKIKW